MVSKRLQCTALALSIKRMKAGSKPDTNAILALEQRYYQALNELLRSRRPTRRVRCISAVMN